MSDQNKSIYEQRIAEIKQLLENYELDAIIVNHDDEYLSYELNESQERIKYISGFSGSAGYVVITANPKEELNSSGIDVTSSKDAHKYHASKGNAVFVDGRYVVQVKEQISSELFDNYDFSKLSVEDYLSQVLNKNAKIGIDMNCISYKEYLKIKDTLEANNMELVQTNGNLVDKIWFDKPEEVISPIEIFNDEYNGCPSPKKRQEIAQYLRDHELDATVICDPESICWLLNIRGKDRKCLPIINCKMVAYSNEALEWYINQAHFVGDDIEYVNDNAICPRCFERYYTTCDCCGEVVHRYDTWSTDCGDIICPACRDEYYYECNECGELISRDYAHWYNDRPYCDSCYDDIKNRVIQDYYYKPAPIFYGCAPCNNPLYMGVELEIDGAGEDDDNAQRLLDIANEFDEHIYCKHDGSIGDGFEIVSHPATLDYHMRDIAWNDIMRSALAMGYRSHDTITCGLHVHVSRNALGNTMDERDETISKIVYFIENNWYEVLRFTRRSESNLRRWASRYGIETDAKTTYKKAKGDYNRYRCINLQNDHTIEFRIFRGTLKYTTFVATLQLVNEICNICKCVSVECIENMTWNEFISRIDTENRAELVEYLKIRGLYV